MAQTYDISTPVGQVRLLIPDCKPGKMRFTDEEITFFLTTESGVLKRAAALGLEVLASNKADAVAYIETNAIKVDGTKAADVLLKRALQLRAQVADLPAPEVAEEDEWDFSFG